MASSPSSPAPRRAALKPPPGASAAVLALGAGIDFKTLSFFEQMVVKMIGSPEGDFPDWAAVGARAQSLVPVFKPTT